MWVEVLVVVASTVIMMVDGGGIDRGDGNGIGRGNMVKVTAR